jgi:NTE family protein
VLRTVPQLVGSEYRGFTERVSWIEDALRARVVIDQLDFASFPQSGYRLDSGAWIGHRSGGLSGRFGRLEAEGTVVRTWGAHTFSLHGLLQMADQGSQAGIERYALGGFHQLSGYQTGQLTGNDVLLARLTWYRRLSQTPALTRGFFVGATLEAGNAWAQRDAMRLTGLRTGMSLFLGADTGLGPLFFGITYAPQGSTGLALFIGRP